MKFIAIASLFFVILFLWLMVHALYKPIYNSFSKDFIIDEKGIRIGNVFLMIMLCLSLVIGLII